MMDNLWSDMSVRAAEGLTQHEDESLEDSIGELLGWWGMQNLTK